MEKGITTAEAAEMLEISQKTVINYLMSGTLAGKQKPVSGRWQVDRSSVEKLLQTKGGQQ